MTQPVDVRRRVVRREDFQHLRVSDFLRERNDGAVGFCAYTTVSHFRMDMIREIDRRRSDGELDDVAFRRKNIDGLFENFPLDFA